MLAHTLRCGFVVAVLVATGAALASASACSSPDANARTDAVGPDRAQFAFVAPVLVRRCGSIDCHGSRYRNMRIYGYGGLRIDGTSPDIPATTTVVEADATYASVVGLEPEIMADVVKSGGAGPERLTFVRKGRGEEDHKGMQRIARGDDSDVCITSWLASKVDTARCLKAGCISTETEAGLPNQVAGCP